ncbi:MAG: hypothetical protein U0805_05635 [Pirellulales bacterium]
MTMAPLGGLLSSAAGASLSQSASSETDRAKDSLAQSRAADVQEHAERSAGIGQTDKDQESSERDADGRRLWEAPANAKKTAATPGPADGAIESRQSKDASGLSGTKLDLMG